MIVLRGGMLIFDQKIFIFISAKRPSHCARLIYKTPRSQDFFSCLKFFLRFS